MWHGSDTLFVCVVVVQADWDKWVDEDEDQTDLDTGGMDMQGMGGMGGPGGGMGGMPGMGGMDMEAVRLTD